MRQKRKLVHIPITLYEVLTKAAANESLKQNKTVTPGEYIRKKLIKGKE